MKSLIVLILLFPLISIFAQVAKKDIRQGNKLFEQNNFSGAEIRYRMAVDKDPKSETAKYNLANALYKQNQYEPCIGRYEGLISEKKDTTNLAGYYYNLGNAYYQSKNLDKSIEAYKQSLRLNPSDKDAKHNLMLALNQKNQQQNNKDQEKNDENKKDQKDKQDKKDQPKEQDQNKQNDKNQQKNNDQNKPSGKQPSQQISKQDAERLLEVLEQDEKEVLKKVQEQKAQVRQVPVDKDW